MDIWRRSEDIRGVVSQNSFRIIWQKIARKRCFLDTMALVSNISHGILTKEKATIAQRKRSLCLRNNDPLAPPPSGFLRNENKIPFASWQETSGQSQVWTSWRRHRDFDSGFPADAIGGQWLF
jgi:hypothetical protein